MLDLSVIKSAAFHYMPAVASNVHRFLRNVNRENILSSHHCWRVVNWDVSSLFRFQMIILDAI